MHFNILKFSGYNCTCPKKRVQIRKLFINTTKRCNKLFLGLQSLGFSFFSWDWSKKNRTEMKESKNKINLNLFTVIFNDKDTLYSSGQAQQFDSILALYQMNINLNLFPFSFILLYNDYYMQT